MTLPDDSEEKWVYTEHAKVKHEILSKYISTWSKILGKYYDLNIFDCFAGRGRYENGTEGSPLKILNILHNLKKNKNQDWEASLFLIESNKNNYNQLNDEVKNFLDEKNNPKWLNVHLFRGEFSELIEDIIEEYGNDISPGFFFIDPFGFGGIPLNIIKKLLSYDRTEVFITFMVRDVNRFLESPPHQDSIINLFGVDNVKEKLREKPYNSLEKEQALLKFYRDQLHNKANVEYTFPFRINADKKLQTIYYLIHCTNHPKGCNLMKSIMFTSGTPGRFGYLGPAEGQLNLNYFTSVGQLKEYLLEKFQNRVLTFEILLQESLMDTYYIKKHFREAIRKLDLQSKG